MRSRTVLVRVRASSARAAAGEWVGRRTKSCSHSCGRPSPCGFFPNSESHQTVARRSRAHENGELTKLCAHAPRARRARSKKVAKTELTYVLRPRKGVGRTQNKAYAYSKPFLLSTKMPRTPVGCVKPNAVNARAAVPKHRACCGEVLLRREGGARDLCSFYNIYGGPPERMGPAVIPHHCMGAHSSSWASSSSSSPPPPPPS